MQADAEALLLMETLRLKRPPRYTWQFADKDVKHIRFKFDKVYQAIAKFIKLWKAQMSPDITGYCPKCPLIDPCLGWHFAGSDRLSIEDLARRRAAFNLSRKRFQIRTAGKCMCLLETLRRDIRTGGPSANGPDSKM